jgi:hypothetical protein
MVKNSLEHLIIPQPQKLLKRASNKLALKEIQVEFSVEEDIIVEMVGEILIVVLEVVDQLL